MREVTQKEFFEALSAIKADIMPSIASDYERKATGFKSNWEYQDGSRKLFGKSESGDFPFTGPRYWIA